MTTRETDAQDLAFELDLVLDTHQPERAPHVRAVVENGIEPGRVQTTAGLSRALARAGVPVVELSAARVQAGAV